MAKFEEGNTASQGKGRPSLPHDLKEARKANSSDLERIINKFLHWALQDLIEYCKDPLNPVFECIVASIMIKGIKEGDTQRLGFLLDRLGIKAPIKTIGEEKENLHSQLVSVIHSIEGSSNGSKKETDKEEKSSSQSSKEKND